jgi:superfamily II DNA/RNA helicase
MAFFNSLRELGGALSLLQRDVPNRRQVLRQRMGREWDEMRQLWNTLELTGRLNSEEVHRAVESLSVSQGDSEKPVDICLASNIIEVGVDIDRLSLLVIVGQPKTTGQYIQVSGRIGRRWEDRPGLVVTLYGATKPRDRSHFEKFRSYHERLHAQVEPTSVTPFSPPALERAAHALLIAHARQTLDTASASRPLPYPAAAISEVSQLLSKRTAVVDPGEAQSLKATLQRRAQEWTAWQPSYWERPSSGEDYLMRDYGDYVEDRNRVKTWPVPNSLRNVDAECRAVITALYVLQAGQTAASGAPDGNGNQDG